jgi:uncharacterized protein (DUF433 family)
MVRVNGREYRKEDFTTVDGVTVLKDELRDYQEIEQEEDDKRAEELYNRVSESVDRYYQEQELKGRSIDEITADFVNLSFRDIATVQSQDASCPKTKRYFTLITGKSLVASLTHRFKAGAENVVAHSIGYQKTMIDDIFSIGDIDREIYKNGTRLLIKELEFNTFKRQGELHTDNMLVTKILMARGESCEYRPYNSNVDEGIERPSYLDGLYRVREMSIRKLLQDYNLDLDKIRSIAKELDHNDIYSRGTAAIERMKKLKNIIIKICDVIEEHVIPRDGFYVVQIPGTEDYEEHRLVEGRILDKLIDHAVEELSHIYSVVDTEEVIVEVEFIKKRDIEDGNLYWSDTYQVGKLSDDTLYVQDSVYHVITSGKNLNVTVFTKEKKDYYINICNTLHKVDTVYADFTTATITISNRYKTKMRITEDEFEKYGIYDSPQKCVNGGSNHASHQNRELEIREKELKNKELTLKLSLYKAQLNAKISTITNVLKLISASDKNTLAVEKLKYEKATAENELNNIRADREAYAHGKEVLGDIARVLI